MVKHLVIGDWKRKEFNRREKLATKRLKKHKKVKTTRINTAGELRIKKTV